MGKKYYAVKNGRVPGIYGTWTECKRQVEHFSGAVYKGFDTLAGAKSFIEGNELQHQMDSAPAGVAEDKEKAVAYVDGSYDPATHRFSCGAVLFFQGEELHISKSYSDERFADMRNVAGEIMGACEVLRHCLKQGIKAVEIHHDYEGVARWAKGEWKANKEGTKAYVNFCKSAEKQLKISFVKVKGHSGDRYNDAADRLAKEALGLV